jgi:hypothetical protein
MNRKNLAKGLKLTLTGLPLAAVVVASFLPLQRAAQQSLILFTLVWIQVFFLFNFFAANK